MTNEEFAHSCTFKLDEARFFLEKIRQATANNLAQDADTEREVLFYSSAFLAAVKAPFGYVLETRSHRNRKTRSQRTEFHNSFIKGMPNMRRLCKLIDTNIQLAPAPEVEKITTQLSAADSTSSKYELIYENQLLLPIFEECLVEITAYIVTAKLTDIFTPQASATGYQCPPY